MTLTVCIVGAGAGGLVAASVLRKRGMQVSVFEAADAVGGVWIHSGSNPGSPMYAGLRTNLPVQMMGFSRDDRFDSPGRSYLGHEDVLHYLARFASREGVEGAVELNARVESVAKQGAAWVVTVRSTGAGEARALRFDAVVVASGHHSKPLETDTPGRDAFAGSQSHSSTYNTPDMYAGLRVLVVGTKASGSDLAREIASHCPATTVHVSDRSLPASHSSTTTASANLHHHPAIQMLTPTGVVFTNAPTPIPIDAILYCTGYAYSFPFLTAPTHVSPSGRHVRPLFKHLFSIPDASLAFLGLPYTVIPFPLMEMQAQWIAAVWLGEAPLPSREEQEAWLAADLSAKAAADSGRDGDNDTRYHFLGPAQWALYEEMICEAGVDVERRSRYVRFLREVWEHVGKTRPTVPGAVDAYRDNVYTVDWDTLEWTVSGPHETLESAVTE